MTTLVTGQVIDTPVNTNLDIWAEIRRLETDRARLVVDWGNGNNDFSGCGACRLENKYAEPGRYTVAAKVVDLNAPSGSAPILSVAVTLNVFDFNPPPTALTCASVTANFYVPSGTAFPHAFPGLTVDNSNGSFNSAFPGLSFFQNGVVEVVWFGKVTLAFDTDKNSMTISVGSVYNGLLPASGTPTSFQAFDAAGNLVASGTKTPTVSALSTLFEERLTISGPRFRRVVLSGPGNVGDQLFYDNLSAGCVP